MSPFAHKESSRGKRIFTRMAFLVGAPIKNRRRADGLVCRGSPVAGERSKAPGRRDAIGSERLPSLPTNSTAFIGRNSKDRPYSSPNVTKEAPPLDRRGFQPAAKVGALRIR
jgi:hypothetical protein